MRTSFILWILNVIVLILYVILGIFSLGQQEVADTGLAAVNNVSVLVPVLIITIFISYVISNFLISLIENQQHQYKQLIEAQESLIQQKKLESIQILSGGIAHDFNNLLTTILGNISLLEYAGSQSAENSKRIKEVKAAGVQARNLTKKLLVFSKGVAIQQ